MQAAKELRIVFMGTPDFAVATLAHLCEQKYTVVAVVTAPDKPAGRGLKLQESAVKKYAVAQGLKVLQPVSLKDEHFLEELNSLRPDMQIVVAFRMLPAVVWQIPVHGTINLHGSLLPQYRGAAPINWAIMNGESKTGVTTFFINEHIDTGDVLLQEEIRINDNDSAGDLHDRMMLVGALLVAKTIDAISAGTIQSIQQKQIEAAKELKPAPKIHKTDCIINWNQPGVTIYNMIRGLSPYPAAITTLTDELGNSYHFKIYKAEKIIEQHSYTTPTVLSDQKTFLRIAVTGGFIALQEIQLQGKNKMKIEDFLRGFKRVMNI